MGRRPGHGCVVLCTRSWGLGMRFWKGGYEVMNRRMLNLVMGPSQPFTPKAKAKKKNVEEKKERGAPPGIRTHE